MQPDTAFERNSFQRWTDSVPDIWRKPLLHLAMAWLGLIALAAFDWAEMVTQWWNFSTYNHILLVPFIVGWLVHLRLPEFWKLKPQAWWPGLIVFAGAMFIWLLGGISGVNFASHLGAVAMLQGAVITILGPRASVGLIFPLAYMLFLVPFGEELVPALQMITADLTIGLTHLSGIPANVDGVFIDTPVGLFEVAEACSGVKFLIAMIALGTLVAHLGFKSWPRRAAFMVLAIVVPIVANGIRAWGTIYIAQFQGVEFAEGFDHIFYGWVFFALVLALVLSIGWKFFDRDIDDPSIDVAAIERSPTLWRFARREISSRFALAALAIIAAAFFIWSIIANSLEAQLPEQLFAPQITGWDQVDYHPQVWWEPRATGADHRLLARYRNAEGREVDLFIAAYASQEDGKEAAAFGEGALMPDSDWSWIAEGPPMANASTARYQAFGRIQRTTATSYRRGDLLTGSATRLKLANMYDKLLMKAEPTVTLIISSEMSERNPDPTASIAAFTQATGETRAFMDAILQSD